MKKLIATSALFFLFGGIVHAQEIVRKCATYSAMEEAFKNDPAAREHYENYQLLKNSRKETILAGGQRGVEYTVPVVFHILHQYGNENISDAQIYDVMRVINREFNGQDPDSVDLVPEFQMLNGNAEINFKLAALDPYGNCTNGIEHIYSHETMQGDDFSKLHQWNRSNYLNIWVGTIIGQPGAAAYAFKPPATDGGGFWRDGIISNHTYVGSIGTSSTFNESTITHEIGHYLGLDHTWGGTNDPEVACGDDGVPDTPITMGHSSFNCLATYAGAPSNGNPWSVCDTTIVEDAQNYMDYSYCDRHFSPDQCTFMRNTLQEIAGQRNVLWADSTLIATGVKDLALPQDPSDQLTVPLCAPIADFTADITTACMGAQVSFSDASYNAVIDDWVWDFDGGTQIGSAQNPIVTWDTPGYKTVTLTSSNAAGSGVETRTNYIYISPDWADFSGPTSINLEGASAGWFIVKNHEENHAKFQLSSGTGYGNSRSYKLNNYKDVSNADPFNEDYFYNQRLGGSVDELITPSFDLRYTQNVVVSFKYSYATNATNTTDITEQLRVYSSSDCGRTWQTRKTILGSGLVTGGYAGYSDYAPVSNNDWETSDFNFTVNTSSDAKVRFKFEFEASDLSSNLYIDDINISGTLGITSNEFSSLNLNVYPNPNANGDAITVLYTAQNEPVTFTLRDAQGKVISTEVLEQTNMEVEHTLNGTTNLPSACYFLEVHSGSYTTTKKVVVL